MGFLLKRQTCILNWIRADVKDFSKKPHSPTQPARAILTNQKSHSGTLKQENQQKHVE
jgi:hypothetical protein